APRRRAGRRGSPRTARRRATHRRRDPPGHADLGLRRRLKLTARPADQAEVSYDEYQGGGLRSISLFGVFVGVAAVGALALSLLAYTQTHHDRAQVKALQARVAHQLAVLRHRNAALGHEVHSTARRLKQKDAGIAPLAA